MTDPHKRNLAVAGGALLASSATLVCCVLPAALISLGAGAALIGLLSAIPQLVWLSQHKHWVFAVAGLVLAISGYITWRARTLPCPADPMAAHACRRLRSATAILCFAALAVFFLGVLFAYLL